MKRLFNKKQHTPPQPSTPEEPVPSRPPPPSTSSPSSGSPSLPPPPRVQNVGNAIGWSVAMPQFDFPYLLALGDHLSSSSQASKDASKALRTEFKHGAPLAQERAVRLTGILMRNTDHRFREQVASKKFLSELNDLVGSKKTEPNVKEMVYRVFSPLAYEYQRDDDLKSITQLFNKLLSSPSTSLSSFPYSSSIDPSSRSFQPNGAPLDPEDPLFTPTGLLPASTTRSGRTSRRAEGGGREGVPKELEKVQMRELGERADKARGLARLLNETIVFNQKDEDDLEKNEMVQEFQSQCLNEQSILGENMVWATVQAEQSRQKLEDSMTTEDRERLQQEDDDANAGAQDEEGEETAEQREMRRSRLSSNNPFAEVVSNGGRTRGERKTEEETILEKILLAHSEIQDALSLLSSRTEQARREKQHEQDLRTATELSKTYVKGGDDISGGGNYGEGGSTQRWGSVEEREQAEHEAMMREQEELDPYERNKQQNRDQGYSVDEEPTRNGSYSHDDSIFSSTTPQNNNASTTASPYDGLGALESLRGLDFSSPSPPPPIGTATSSQAQAALSRTSFPSSNPYSNLSLSTDNSSQVQRDPFTESPVSSSFIPNQPSEKALGKLRRISTTGRTEDDSEERQRILEEQLREKYKRNLEENGGIREV
ncbi:uncharacterized protein JCM6883_002701 [Sporobolomyces salmoneus]|uniref:uncharacterized protein n=1 Tax=Sporobolomyces salmoneus TaxID=183962 RepID=UPI003177458D